MVDVAQSVRASDCGSEGRRFETDLPPRWNGELNFDSPFFYFFSVGVFSLSGLRNSEQRVEKVNDHTIQGWMRCTPDGKESVVSMPGK